MSSHLSRFFEEKRLAKGLKPGQLARLAGCKNIPKNGDRIRQFELTGKISQELLLKIAVVLEINQATIMKLIEQDRKEFLEKWLKWVREPIRPYLVVRLMPAIYNHIDLPEDIKTMEEAEQWASSFAREKEMRCCLVWSRRISCWFDEKGTLYARTEATPGEANEPWMTIGGRTFTFGHDFASVVPVDWPKTESNQGLP